MPASSISLPDPQLQDAATGILLRRWGLGTGDAEALTAAWNDPQVVAGTAVPADRSVDAAERWIAGEAERRRRGLALDLVASSFRPEDADFDPDVLGEVGLANLEGGRAEVGFWLAAHARGRGVATAAVRMLTGWALAPRGPGLRQVWARTRPANAPAAGVLERAGFTCLGAADSSNVWSFTSLQPWFRACRSAIRGR